MNAYIPNFTIPQSIHNDTLLNRSGAEYLPFTIFINYLIDRGYAESTIELYGGAVIRFLNYLSRYLELLDEPLTSKVLRKIMDSYAYYLLRGQSSSNKKIKQIAQDLKREKNSEWSSLAVIDQAITQFILVNEIEKMDILAISDSQFLNVNTRVKSNAELNKVTLNAAMVGFIRGGMKKTKRTTVSVLNLKKPKKKSKIFITKTIEFNQISKLIECASSYRDKAFYALLAASGSRGHESLQIRLTDIDFDKREVRLVSPYNVKRSELNLTPKEESLLAWKGRDTTSTFLIEPFKTIFFENLELYLKNERFSLCNHPFVFTNSKNNRPYFASDRSSRIKMFKNAAQKSGIEDIEGISPHSLRHTYATYVLNWLPLKDNQFGLPLVYVQKLMGHSSILSTEIYAKIDEELVKAHVANANEQLFNNILDFNQIKLKYHRNEIEKLEKKLAA